ncbi:MAG: tetratricopeptide repeat protein [Bacteroidia bacterium]|nr:tetratricopeptide repeat protein [Bacteroidia bacterium]
MIKDLKYKFILFTFLLVLEGFSQQYKIDSVNVAIKNAKHDTTRMSLYIALSTYFYVSNPDTIIPICLEAIAIADRNMTNANALEKRSYLKNRAGALNNIAVVYKNRGDIAEALEAFIKTVKLYEDIGEKKGVANAFNNIGAIYDNQGDIPKALECFGKSLKILEEVGNKKGAASALNNIGFIYSSQGDFVKALEYHNKSLAIRKEINDEAGMGASLNNIGGIYRKQGDILKALSYFNESLKIREKIGDKKGIGSSLANIAAMYVLIGDPDCSPQKSPQCMQVGMEKALTYFFQSLKIREEIKDKQAIASTLSSIGGVYIQQRKYALAATYIKRALVISRELGFPELIFNSERLMSRVDSATNNFEGALEHYKQYIKYHDSITNEQTRKASIKSQLKYEFEKKEAVIKEQQEKERIIAEEKDRFQKIVIGSVIIGLLLVIIFAAFVFRSLRTTRKQKLLIEEKQKEILDSIRYAKRIQTSLLPTEKYITNVLDRSKKK